MKRYMLFIRVGIGFAYGFIFRSVLGYMSFYGVMEGAVRYFIDWGYLVKGILIWDSYLFWCAFDHLFVL
jgi:hypothetical protein